MFSEWFTHAGVACGCDSTYGDICCIMLGNNIVDVSAGWMDPLPVKTFSKKDCPKSASLSSDTVGEKEQYHFTKDPGTQYVMNEKNIGQGTFEKISKGLFEEFWLMKNNPSLYSKKINSKLVEQEILSFTWDDVEWSDLLAALSWQHVNYDGPCHYTIETDGIDKQEYFNKYMKWNKDIHIV